jgi:hypothetical protein
MAQSALSGLFYRAFTQLCLSFRASPYTLHALSSYTLHTLSSIHTFTPQKPKYTYTLSSTHVRYPCVSLSLSLSLSRARALSLSPTHTPTPTHLNSVTRVEDKTVHMRAFRLLWRCKIRRELPFHACFFLKKKRFTNTRKSLRLVCLSVCLSPCLCLPPHPSLHLRQPDSQVD